MNLFRSEEHARRWDRFTPATANTLRPLRAWADIFSNPYFRQRVRPDFISWALSPEGMGAFEDLRRAAS